ncbi:unnamed protein product, partial [Ixodes pacificus]
RKRSTRQRSLWPLTPRIRGRATDSTVAGSSSTTKGFTFHQYPLDVMLLTVNTTKIDATAANTWNRNGRNGR